MYWSMGSISIRSQLRKRLATRPPPEWEVAFTSRFPMRPIPTWRDTTISRWRLNAFTICRIRSRALRALRGLVGDAGTVFVVDQRVAETFSPPGDDGERSKYGYSVFHCLPISMVEQPSAATGTVIRESTMRRYAEQAGFRSLDVLPIEDDTFRFYRMMG